MPCECGNFKLGSRFDLSQCRLCWNYAHDKRYRERRVRNFELADVPIVVLSLSWRSDRRRRLQEHFARERVPNRVEFVQAVDGSKLRPPTMWPVSSGAYGCRYSHILQLLRVIETQRPLWIFEDDATLVPGFWAQATAFYRECPSTWQVLYFGGEHWKSPLSMPNKRVVRCVDCRRTHSYLIKPAGAAELLRAYDEGDDHIDKLAKWAQLEIPCFAPESFLVAQGPGYSDIEQHSINKERFVQHDS